MRGYYGAGGGWRGAQGPPTPSWGGKDPDWVVEDQRRDWEEEEQTVKVSSWIRSLEHPPPPTREGGREGGRTGACQHVGSGVFIKTA